MSCRSRSNRCRIKSSLCSQDKTFAGITEFPTGVCIKNSNGDGNHFPASHFAPWERLGPALVPSPFDTARVATAPTSLKYTGGKSVRLGVPGPLAINSEYRRLFCRRCFPLRSVRCASARNSLRTIAQDWLEDGERDRRTRRAHGPKSGSIRTGRPTIQIQTDALQQKFANFRRTQDHETMGYQWLSQALANENKTCTLTASRPTWDSGSAVK